MRKAAVVPRLPGTSQTKAVASKAPTTRLDLILRLRPYLYIAPAMICFVLFFFYPIGSIIYLSFQDWSLVNLDEMDFVGLQNYRDLIADGDFREVLGNTAMFTVSTVGIGLAMSFLLALWLNRQAKVYGIIQATVFSPHIISLVSVSMLWMWLMDPQFGLLNAALEAVGLPAYTWLTDPKSSLLSLIIVSIWKGVGYNTLIFIAGLQSIPGDIYEAAALDQSPRWRTLTRITVPMLSPTIFFLLIINTISSFQAFDTIAIMTQGGPVNSTNMMVYYIYQQGMDFYNGGLASAASVILLILVSILTALHFLIMSKRVHYR